MNQTVIFLHIPKAAGTTLLTVLDQNYPATATYPVTKRTPDTLHDLEALPESQRRQYQLLRGHMFFGLHEALPQASTYITLLRDPVERVLSMYYYIQRNPNHYLYERVVKENLSIAAAVETGISNELRNGQVRLLNSQAFAKDNRENLDVLLETALQNLESHFVVVGFVERFDETLLLLRRALGWKMPYYTKRNVTRQRPARETLSPDDLQIIEAYHQTDTALYRRVSEQFEQLIAKQGVGFQQELNRFRLMNRVYGRLYSIRAKLLK